MPFHQPHDGLPQVRPASQPPEHPVRQLPADGGVPVEVAHARAVHGEAGGFPHVVEQHRTAQHRLPRRRVQGVESVLPDVVAVVPVPLVEAHHGQQLRPEDAEDVRERPQDRRRPGARQQLEKLRPDPLRGDVLQKLPLLVDGLRRRGLDLQLQRRREAEPPEDAQGVLPEAPARLPHAAEPPPLQVRPAPEGVPELSPEVHGHGVDGEVPAGQVLLQGAGEGHRVRTAVVAVLPVDAVGRHLHRAARRPDRERAVLQARGLGAGGEDRRRLLRQGAGGHVPVLRAPSRQAAPVPKAVPDAPAHAPRLVARRLQGPQDRLHIPRDLHGSAPFRRCIPPAFIL